MNATVEKIVTSTYAETAVIEAAKKGVNNATLLKAVWSTRGPIRVPVTVAGVEVGVAIVKSDLVNILKAFPGAESASFILVPTVEGADLVTV